MGGVWGVMKAPIETPKFEIKDDGTTDWNKLASQVTGMIHCPEF
jgi:hypothetical protein